MSNHIPKAKSNSRADVSTQSETNDPKAETTAQRAEGLTGSRTGLATPTIREKYAEFDRLRIELNLIEAADALVATTKDARNPDYTGDVRLKVQIERRAADLALHLLAIEARDSEEFERKYVALLDGQYPESSALIYSLAAFALRLEAVRLDLEIGVETVPAQTH
jgi:hypothetical protein